MFKQTSFLIMGAILVAAIVTVALYNVNLANAQANMIAGGGNMANMTVPYKGYPAKGFYSHGVYTKHSYYSHGHWYEELLLNETGESNETGQH
jgi:hypothetical protein